MKLKIRRLILIALVALLLPGPRGASAVFPVRPAMEPDMTFTVSLDPSAHLFHVAFQIKDLDRAEFLDFKLPVWMPGYYGLQDYPSRIRNFKAFAGGTEELAWEKTTDNTWRVVAAGAPEVALFYDVLATSSFVAQSFLDETHGHIAPCSVFLSLDGYLSRPVSVDIEPVPGWSIATGLDRHVPDHPNSFSAPDFDTLYDCPIVMGKLDALPPFEIRGVPHYFTGYQLGITDGEGFMKDLKPVVEAGINIIGEIPYRHYTFLGIGPGMGGIEHLNSVGMGFSYSGAETRAKKIRTLAFLAHEYFHCFNVKRIRPIALGPFDYNKPNLTRMLWVSEGFTSYYEAVMLRRSGTTTPEEFYAEIGGLIASYENKPGRLFQSATQSSFDSWTQGPFGGRGQGIVKTISYYDKGAVLGALLDLAIRERSKNLASLDTVMRALYQKFHKGLGRGWTDEEFQAACEKAAGGSLSEVFEYASTTKDVDYAKYFAYAGLEFEKPVELPEAFWGGLCEDGKDGRPVVAATEPGSPARGSGLAAGDIIVSWNGEAKTSAAIEAAVKARKPGDQIKLVVARGGSAQEREIVLANKLKRTWMLRPIAGPNPLQRAILKDWIGN